MLTNAFIGAKHPPTEEQLASCLGPVKKIWDNLLADLAQHNIVDGREWNSYSSKAGWALRLKHGERVIVYLSPGDRAFLASFALGEKALAAARAGKLPPPVLTVIDQAKRYAEGTAVRLEIRRAGEIPVIRKLAAAKLHN